MQDRNWARIGGIALLVFGVGAVVVGFAMYL